ncbi:MAG: YqiA/YcfP family alpha/beta fold hydrolase [Nitrospinota bacterium]
MTEFIYLHGFASGPNSNKARVFKKHFERLNISLHIPDLQEDDFENLTLSRQILLVQSIIDEMQDNAFGLIGSSMGGYLATLIAQTREQVKALYLMAPGFNFLTRWSEKLNLSESPQEFIPVFHYRYNEEVLLNTQLFRDAEIWESQSLDRNIPIRIAHGLHDETVSIEESRNYARERSYCMLKELDSDHGLLSCVEWIVEDCLDFFRAQDIL